MRGDHSDALLPNSYTCCIFDSHYFPYCCSPYISIFHLRTRTIVHFVTCQLLFHFIVQNKKKSGKYSHHFHSVAGMKIGIYKIRKNPHADSENSVRTSWLESSIEVDECMGLDIKTDFLTVLLRFWTLFHCHSFSNWICRQHRRSWKILKYYLLWEKQSL